jgi:hypothetical protein
MSRNAVLFSLTSMCLAAGIGLAAAQTPQLSLPTQVQKALGAINRVVDTRSV